ncbi:MAG: phage portal protein [Chthoniobacteraceae bacterium]
MSARQIAPVQFGTTTQSLSYVPGISGPLTALQMPNGAIQFASYGDKPWQRGGSGGQAGNAASESWKKHKNRVKAMWDARDLCTHDWIGGALGKVVVYVVGELECKSNTGDPEIDAAYDQYFHAWCGDDHDEDGTYPCDITGRHRFIKLVQLALLAMLVDGDHGFVIRLEIDGIKLQSIEADRIGSPIDAQQTETYIGGFTIDEDTGKPITIRVFQRTRHGQYVKPVEIEPERFVHIWDPDRVDQYRGVTALLRLLEDCRDLRETLEAERIAIKDQSQFVGTVTSKTGRNGAGDWEDDVVTGTKTQKAMWGKWLRMGEGESVNFLTPSSRPSGAFMQFMQILIRKMAISLKLSYGFLWDLAMLGGVSQRVEVRGDERQINHWQRILVDRMLRRVRRAVLDYGIAMREIPAHPSYRQCTWHFGERLITDAGYEVNNDVTLLNNGLVAADDVATKYSRNGGGLSDVLQRNAAAVLRAQQISGDSRVPIELLAAQLWPNATQLLAASNTPPEPPPEPGSIEAIGDKGAKQITEILIAVANDQLDRDSAINTLVTVYGLDPAHADLITPPQGIANIMNPPQPPTVLPSLAGKRTPPTGNKRPRPHAA